MSKETFTLEIEYTDTFGGEANYCWVKRETIEVPVGLSDKAIMRRAKKAVGVNGSRGRHYYNGDQWEFRPYRACEVMFAHVKY